jgi:hypothetical protein
MISATPARHKTGSASAGYRILPIIASHLRGGLTQFKLVAHFLEARSESFNLLLLSSYGRFLLCRS